MDAFGILVMRVVAAMAMIFINNASSGKTVKQRQENTGADITESAH
jgi:hypothetical protein